MTNLPGMSWTLACHNYRLARPCHCSTSAALITQLLGISSWMQSTGSHWISQLHSACKCLCHLWLNDFSVFEGGSCAQVLKSTHSDCHWQMRPLMKFAHPSGASRTACVGGELMSQRPNRHPVQQARQGSNTECCRGRQELWSLLASASTTDSGIPQSILDKLAEELQQKKDIQDAINVRLSTLLQCSSSEDLKLTRSHDSLCFDTTSSMLGFAL